jgi:hypothetical protein
MYQRYPVPNLVYTGVALMIVLRGIQGAELEALKSLLGDDKGVCDRAVEWSKTWDITGQLRGVENFAVWPIGRHAIREHVKALEKEVGNRRLRVPPQRAKEWKRYSKMWCKEGIKPVK